ncbi:MAG TPA: hypothetical protein EYH30_09875 [Anaerolineales bacterium]|nr:hypothetical protein [Anaerolineae bacterium]HIQ02412.1 hypothetical protein [Anaerolineales bacterium]
MGKRVFWVAAGVLLLGLTASVAWAAPPGQEGEVTADALWITLAPLIAIATSVERILEVIWDRWEEAGVWPNRAGVADAKAPEYISWKKLYSHWIGMFVALIAIGLTNVRLFRLLGFDVLFSSSNMVLFDAGIGGIFDNFTVGTLIDWLLTAGIIGWGGTELTHSVIEGLVKGRNLWKEMREVEAGRKSILDAKFFNDYVAPQLEKRGVSVASLRRAFEALRSVGVPADQIIGQMTVGKVDEFLSQLEAESRTAPAAQALRTLLEGVPPEQQVEIPNVLNLLTPEQRRRFLGA